MSPFKMFHSCGSSSRPVTLRMWPILVTASLAGFHSTSEREFTRIERNLRTSTMTPRWPTRCWRKWTGPGLDSFTARARRAYRGESRSRPTAATDMSKARLAAQEETPDVVDVGGVHSRTELEETGKDVDVDRGVFTGPQDVDHVGFAGPAERHDHPVDTLFKQH